MLTVKVPMKEGFDDQNQKFVDFETFDLELEHSLVSLSKWESEFEKPFLGPKEKSTAEVLWYIKAMVLTPNVPEEVFQKLSKENFDTINAYISAKMTATTFAKTPDKKNAEIITAELIYYWLSTFQIPYETQYWHLNRLLTLIKVFSVKNAPEKKMNKKERFAQQRALNEARRRQAKSSG